MSAVLQEEIVASMIASAILEPLRGAVTLTDVGMGEDLVHLTIEMVAGDILLERIGVDNEVALRRGAQGSMVVETIEI